MQHWSFLYAPLSCTSAGAPPTAPPASMLLLAITCQRPSWQRVLLPSYGAMKTTPVLGWQQWQTRGGGARSSGVVAWMLLFLRELLFLVDLDDWQQVTQSHFPSRCCPLLALATAELLQLPCLYCDSKDDGHGRTCSSSFRCRQEHRCDVLILIYFFSTIYDYWSKQNIIGSLICKLCYVLIN